MELWRGEILLAAAGCFQLFEPFKGTQHKLRKQIGCCAKQYTSKKYIKEIRMQVNPMWSSINIMHNAGLGQRDATVTGEIEAAAECRLQT